MLNGLDLFSGIGGISTALSPWVRSVAYCENDRYAQAVLLSRMRDGQLHQAPIWDDVRTLCAQVLPSLDIISGGFPCQDISVAGNGIGLGGERSGLFFEIIRLASELRPRFVFLENVPAITVRGLDRVLLEFTKIGYDCRWTIVSAAEVGAPHLRERWFLLAYSHSNHSGDQWKDMGRENRKMGERKTIAKFDGIPREMAYADSSGFKEQLRSESDGKEKLFAAECSRWWEVEPDVGRVANGVPQRVDRLRGLGNAVVPQTAREAFQRLLGI